MKTLDQLKSECESWRKDCIYPSKVVLNWIGDGFITPYDGDGYAHNGEEYLRDISIFDLIEREQDAGTTFNEFIEKYPYIAWYNK